MTETKWPLNSQSTRKINQHSKTVSVLIKKIACKESNLALKKFSVGKSNYTADFGSADHAMSAQS